jgi:hypothetical protein
LGVKSTSVFSEFEDSEKLVEINLHFGKLKHKVENLFDVFFEEMENFKNTDSFEISDEILESGLLD